ncbi:MAG: winged helix-turn-helix transcriptional regulator [Methanobacteriaceae archaeon]|nr:winged helix-turn-helix transcriptional regulator [Methanobacteriaceae archaeon]
MITEIFGENCVRAKVFDLLLSHPNTEYTKKDIAECADISRTTLNKFIDKLVDYEIMIPTRRIGNGQFYKINMDSTITKALNSFQNQLADIEIEREMQAYKEEIDESIEPIKPFEEIIKRQIIKKSDSSLNKEKYSIEPPSEKSGFRFSEFLGPDIYRAVKPMGMEVNPITISTSGNPHKVELVKYSIGRV